MTVRHVGSLCTNVAVMLIADETVSRISKSHHPRCVTSRTRKISTPRAKTWGPKIIGFCMMALTELSREASMRFLNPSVVPAACINRWRARSRALRSVACSNVNEPIQHNRPLVKRSRGRKEEEEKGRTRWNIQSGWIYKSSISVGSYAKLRLVL